MFLIPRKNFMIEKRPYEWFDSILAAENLASNGFHKVFDGIKAERKEKAEKADAEYLAWYEKSEKEKKMNETTALAVIPEVKVKQPAFLENLTETAKSIPFKDVLERKAMFQKDKKVQNFIP